MEKVILKLLQSQLLVVFHPSHPNSPDQNHHRRPPWSWLHFIVHSHSPWAMASDTVSLPQSTLLTVHHFYRWFHSYPRPHTVLSAQILHIRPLPSFHRCAPGLHPGGPPLHHRPSTSTACFSKVLQINCIIIILKVHPFFILWTRITCFIWWYWVHIHEC